MNRRLKEFPSKVWSTTLHCQSMKCILSDPKMCYMSKCNTTANFTFKNCSSKFNSAVLLEPSHHNKKASPSILYTWRTVSLLQQVNKNYGDVCLLRGEALAKSSIAVLTCNTCKNCTPIFAKFLQCSILTTYIKENNSMTETNRLTFLSQSSLKEIAKVMLCSTTD